MSALFQEMTPQPENTFPRPLPFCLEPNPSSGGSSQSRVQRMRTDRTTAKLTAFCHFSQGLGSGLVHVLAGSFLFLDLVWTAIYPFVQLFSLPL